MTIRSHSPLPFVLALSGVLGLAACAAPPQAKVNGVSPAEPVSYTPSPGSTGPQVPGSAPVTPSPPSLADLAHGPQHFEGLEGKDVIAALGDPSFRRRETPAEVWQYYGPGCILDLFLYDDGASPGASATGKPIDGVVLDGKVAHAELRGREGQPAEPACLSRLIGQRHNQRAG